MTSECWVWSGARNDAGYGQIWKDGRVLYAHRVIYSAVIGEIPEGLQIDHLCRNRACVRPDHMEMVTPRENTLRGQAPSAQAARLVNCVKGHDAWRATPSGKRECTVCAKARHARRVRSHGARG